MFDLPTPAFLVDNRRPQRWLSLFAAVACLLTAQVASAATNDIRLRGLIERDAQGNIVRDAQNNAVLRQDDFKALTTELGFILTPSPLQPAETTGQSGFDYAIGGAIHIGPNQFGNDRTTYWQDATEGNSLPVMTTLGVRGRKGFILPIPMTSEVELGAQWLVDSNLLNLGGKLRLALNEGFAWIPDFAVEAGVNRLVGSQELDFTTITAGGSVSKGFGVFGDFNLTPFASYQAILINAASRLIVVDPTRTADVSDNLETFQRIDAMTFANGQITGANLYHRMSAGVRFHVAIVAIYIGADVNYMPDRPDDPFFFSIASRAGLLF